VILKEILEEVAPPWSRVGSSGHANTSCGGHPAAAAALCRVRCRTISSPAQRGTGAPQRSVSPANASAAVIRSLPAILRTDDSSTSMCSSSAGHDRAVLLEDFFGLHIGVVTDDHRFEQVLIGRHGRGRRERQRRHQARVSQFRGGGDIPVGGVVVLHCTGVLADLLSADPVGVVHLVLMAHPRFKRRCFCCCGYEITQLFYRLGPKHTNAQTPQRYTPIRFRRSVSV